MLLPDHETAVDFLNYEAIATTVVKFLVQNRERAMTLGIHGDWGAGKSSILKMIEAEVAHDKDIACLWFNGWAFQGFDDAKTVLIEATITELCRQRSATQKVKDLAAKLIRRVDWLKVARRGAGLAFTVGTGLPSPDMVHDALAGVNAVISGARGLKPEDIEARLSEAASFLKPAEGTNLPELMHHFREEFRQLLDEAKIKQLVVLIDDLDRCLPATAIDTLEAIRLFLFVPKTAFVIGADEAMIEYAVRQHFPDLPVAPGTTPYVRSYLEKLVQVPFRIPALGTQETRAYVTLLLVGDLVGEEHDGFKALLAKARTSLNQPWLGSDIKQSDVEAVDPTRKGDLVALYVLAQQIGPMLAEGTKGNPRQVKRFLNALLVREAIAEARGFRKNINSAVLGKLMLAERFQADFYEFVAGRALSSKDGKVPEIAELEGVTAGDGKRTAPEKKSKTSARDTSEELTKWLDRDWMQNWLSLKPTLGDVDLRPYVFVARDKRIASVASEAGGLEGLIDRLRGSAIAVRSVEPQVKALSASDAEQVFGELRERVLGHGSFEDEPPGFYGMGIVAKHHPRFQGDMLSVIGSIDEQELGVWVVKGWNEVVTEQSARDQLGTLMAKWAAQSSNILLKRAAAQSNHALKKAGG